MILKNLIPNAGFHEFRAKFDVAARRVCLALHDPSTGCQTHEMQIITRSWVDSLRVLHAYFGAIGLENTSKQYLQGLCISGIAKGEIALPTTLSLGREMILTPGVTTPWFTGRAVPFESRGFPLRLWEEKGNFSKPHFQRSQEILTVISTYPEIALSSEGLCLAHAYATIEISQDVKTAISHIENAVSIAALGESPTIMAGISAILK